MKKLLAFLLCASLLCAFVAIPAKDVQEEEAISVCEIFDEEDEMSDVSTLF